MTEYLFLAVILLLRFPQSFCSKKTSALVNNGLSYFLYGTYSYLLAALAALALLIFNGAKGFGPAAVGISALGALALAANLYCSMEALKNGVMVLASIFGSAGLLIPCIGGIFLFDEPMNAMQFVGIALLIFSGWLLIGYSKSQKGTFSLKTFLLLLGCMLSNGTIMVAQKMFSKFLPNADASIFSFLSFGLVGIGMAVGLVFQISTKEKRSEIPLLPKKLFLYATISSVALLAINQLATIAGRVVPSAVMFPINDGGATIVSALTAAVFFKEKLNVRSVAGLLIGIASLVIINLF